jgi:putative ATP-dependent endonuclease of OLD family
MRIVFLEIRNFRGIKHLDWAPAPAVNCLIGPGDSTKTTILDAIELVLNPRSHQFADDSDFYNLDFDNQIAVTITLASLPSEFLSDERYGMHLRGWNEKESKVEDEPGESLKDALSVRVTIDKSLETRWSIYNERIREEEGDPPTVRYKDAKQFATTRLGPFAERHLSWGRQSVLTRIGEAVGSISLELAQASRAAREAFRGCNHEVFKDTASRAEQFSKQFAVPVRDKYVAEIDVQGVNITTGGISLHDGKLPLRRLGTGSSRLIVSALQHNLGGANLALIDEVELGLEPHRIARLLQYLKSAPNEPKTNKAQIFMTTHSPVVILELSVHDIFTVRSNVGHSGARSVAATAKDINVAQSHLRAAPDAFLAHRVIVGEGRTEHGLLRGLDGWWSMNGKESFALKGSIPIDGGGTNAPVIAEHLLDLGYHVSLLLDSDVEIPIEQIDGIKNKGGGRFSSGRVRVRLRNEYF